MARHRLRKRKAHPDKTRNRSTRKEVATRFGRLEDARLTLEKMSTYANHLGLYSEEIGLTGEALGNFPQAFSHLAHQRGAQPGLPTRPQPRLGRTGPRRRPRRFLGIGIRVACRDHKPGGHNGVIDSGPRRGPVPKGIRYQGTAVFVADGIESTAARLLPSPRWSEQGILPFYGFCR